MYRSYLTIASFKISKSRNCYDFFIKLLNSKTLLLLILCQTPNAYAESLVELSLEELANIQVTSVSKRSEALTDAAASIFVITNNEIQRSGASTLPEALRLAPNLQVAQDNSRNYAITARGFNSVFSNKLLVLIDGRTVYSPLFSGVFWDAQDVMLEDIDRIEVISGANTTLWGANAVNGVINIITKNAKQSQGGLVSISGSSNESYSAIRYGGKLLNDGNFRVYAKHAEVKDKRSESNSLSLNDGFKRDKAGFRADWVNDNKNFTLQGDFYDGYLNQANTNDIQISGANLLGRVNSKLENGSNMFIQAYLDYTYRNQPNAFKENLTTADIEFKHDWRIADRHNFTWGGGYKVGFDRLDNFSFAFLPAKKNLHWANIFVQDEIDLNEQLRLTLGIKFEHNNYTDLEYMPNARLAWKITENKLLWASATRAIRAPSRIDRDFFAPPLTAGSPNFDSAVAHTYEIGYRVSPNSDTLFSITGFYTDYDRLRTFELDTSTLAFVFDNNASGHSQGIEMWGSWQVRDNLKLSGGLVVQEVRVNTHPADILQASGLGINDPSSHSIVRVSYDFNANHLLDVTARHMGKLNNPAVPAYTALDLRYAWKVMPDLELSVVGQNLLDSKHPEFSNAAIRPEYDRSLFAKLQWYFR